MQATHTINLSKTLNVKGESEKTRLQKHLHVTNTVVLGTIGLIYFALSKAVTDIYQFLFKK